MCVSTDIGLYAADHRCGELSAEGCRRPSFECKYTTSKRRCQEAELNFLIFLSIWLYMVIIAGCLANERTNVRRGSPSRTVRSERRAEGAQIYR